MVTPRPRRTSPPSGSRVPAMIDSSVDLPVPLMPTTPRRSPLATVTDTSENSGRFGLLMLTLSTSTRITWRRLRANPPPCGTPIADAPRCPRAVAASPAHPPADRHQQSGPLRVCGNRRHRANVARHRRPVARRDRSDPPPAPRPRGRRFHQLAGPRSGSCSEIRQRRESVPRLSITAGFLESKLRSTLLDVAML